MKKIILISTLTLLSQITFAVDCKKGQIVRKVEVNYEVEGKKAPCSVKYTKEDGTEKILFTAKAEEGYCEKKSANFIEKMKVLGFDCAAN
ncbi:MAG: hypothetical protein WA160_04830 [Pseudobdellovibrio sp.]